LRLVAHKVIALSENTKRMVSMKVFIKITFNFAQKKSIFLIYNYNGYINAIKFTEHMNGANKIAFT